MTQDEYWAKLMALHDECVAKLMALDAEYAARWQPLYDEYWAGGRAQYDEYRAKCLALDAECATKRQPLETEYRAQCTALDAEYAAGRKPMAAEDGAKDQTLDDGSGWHLPNAKHRGHHGVPTNAVYGRWTGSYGGLGGPVWQYADGEGRNLGETTYVPANFLGERTRTAGRREPGRVVIPELLLRKLRLLLRSPGSFAANSTVTGSIA